MIQPRTPSESPTPPGSSQGSSLRVNVVLFRWNGTELEAATCSQARLPSSAPNVDESLDHAAERIIRESSGIDAQYVEQLYTFSRSESAHREIVISYLGLFSPESTRDDRESAIHWSPANTVELTDDIDRMVVQYALVRLQAKLGYTNIAFYLVPATFTLSELQQTYESILGQPMDKRNFRRRMISSGILTDTHEQRREGSHRPAALYRFSHQDDHAAYLTPPWRSGINASEPNEGV